MVWDGRVQEGRVFQAENSVWKGPVAGVCEEQAHPHGWRGRGEGVWCERQARPHQPGRLMGRPGVVS